MFERKGLKFNFSLNLLNFYANNLDLSLKTKFSENKIQRRYRLAPMNLPFQ